MSAVAPPDASRLLLDRWRALRPWAKFLLAAGTALLAFNVGVSVLNTITGGSGPAGPTSSSYATSPTGLAALAELLADHGHPVRRIRTTLDRATLDPGATLVLADAGAGGPAELDAVGRFVVAGGRLVVTGTGAADLVGALAGTGPDPSGRSATPAEPLVVAREVAGVEEVVGDGNGAFTADTGAALPLLGSPRAVLAAVAAVGRGRVVALADTSPWHNRHLDEADNAAFALAVFGEAGRAVHFAEAPHGYGTAEGLGAFPPAWKWAAAIGVLAVLVAMWAKGRRLGEPELLERELPPPRRTYVDAMASTLARSKQPAEAQAALQAAARRRLAHRAGLGPDASDDALRQAALRAGLTEEEIDGLAAPPAGEHGVVGAARALARLEGGER